VIFAKKAKIIRSGDQSLLRGDHERQLTQEIAGLLPFIHVAVLDLVWSSHRPLLNAA
jgi:hypothetical protein